MLSRCNENHLVDIRSRTVSSLPLIIQLLFINQGSELAAHISKGEANGSVARRLGHGRIGRGDDR